MKKFFILFLSLFLLLISSSAFAYSVSYDLANSSPSDLLDVGFVPVQRFRYWSNSILGSIMSVDSSYGESLSLTFPKISTFDIVDGSDIQVNISYYSSTPLLFEVSSVPDFSDVTLTSLMSGSSSMSNWLSFSTEISFSYSSYKNGYVYMRIVPRDSNESSLYLSSISISTSYRGDGDVTIQEVGSFDDLQYVVDLLKSFFFGGSVTDPDSGSSVSFGESGSGGIMNFIVYSSGGNDFALWHLLVAAAITGLGITFVIRLAGSFKPSDVSKHFDNNDSE